jgi:hypothetical protein
VASHSKQIVAKVTWLRFASLRAFIGTNLVRFPLFGQIEIISWPVAAVGFTLQQSSGLPGGWANSGLVTTVEGNENAACTSVTGNGLFYRLAK